MNLTFLRPQYKAILTFLLFFQCGQIFSQYYDIILGRPTDTSMTVSIMFDQSVIYYLEYGKTAGTYTVQSTTFNSTLNVPDEITLRNLTPNTRYYYRVRYKLPSAATFAASPEYNFITQRPPGSSFVFTLEADEHLYDKKGIKNMYQVTLNNQAADKPDFMMSLGDIFGDDHYPNTITSAELDQLHKDYRPFLGSICHSIPFYVCLGNHEGENDYYFGQNGGNNLCVWGTQWRKYYFPNPSPNSFYSGNTAIEPYGIGNPENYYAWNWGDALFVVLDVYRDQCDTSPKPKNWDWTLGLPQYTWLKNTLEGSTAKYKFVFAHHIRGQGRGGIQEAKLFEWGGLQSLTGTNTFATYRPGWAKPIHQLFKDTKVTIFFQGHDHVFAHEVLDSIVYQALPMAADSTYEIGMLANADSYVSDTVDGTGHVRVSVTPECVKVDYVKAYLPADTITGVHKNKEIGFTYTIGKCAVTSELLNNQTNVVNIANIYPNPVADNLSIQYLQDDPSHTASLHDMAGTLLRKTDKEHIEVSDLPEGIYMLRLNAGNESVIKKIIIQHK